MRLPRAWRRRPHITLDSTAGQEATAARIEAEAAWADVNAQRARQEQQRHQARRMRDQNHFAQKAQHALGGRA